jgi:hypothetical protein
MDTTSQEATLLHSFREAPGGELPGDAWAARACEPPATVVRVTDTPGTSALTQQMLEWIDERPRTYSEAIDAWKTSCPRLTIWEDAVGGELVRVDRGSVSLTDAGRQKVASRTPATIASSTSPATTKR